MPKKSHAIACPLCPDALHLSETFSRSTQAEGHLSKKQGQQGHSRAD